MVKLLILWIYKADNCKLPLALILYSLQWRHNERLGVSNNPASRLFTQPFIQGADQRKRQSSAWLAFVRGIHRWPVNSPHKGPVTRKVFPFDDVIMLSEVLSPRYHIFPTTDHSFRQKVKLLFTLWEAVLWLIQYYVVCNFHNCVHFDNLSMHRCYVEAVYTPLNLTIYWTRKSLLQANTVITRSYISKYWIQRPWWNTDHSFNSQNTPYSALTGKL